MYTATYNDYTPYLDRDTRNSLAFILNIQIYSFLRIFFLLKYSRS
jgi:hypothetical protein